MLDRKKPFFTWIIFRVFLSSTRRGIRRFNRAISSLPSFISPSAISGCSSVLIWLVLPSEFSLRSRISRHHAAVCRCVLSSGAPHSSFAPCARDADAVCRTRAFAFSLRVTEHSIEPGWTIPSGRPSLPAHSVPLFCPFLPVSINQSILQ